ncbi:MAG: hypothetical protein PHU12_03035 [Candidatus Aenigmarchaeota archaeon]|nr:hypothetical protein [Candidatus Aenigmarchaeota archaeon]
MQICLKLGDIYTIFESFNKVVERLSKLDNVPIKLNYKFAKLYNAIQQEYLKIVEQQEKLINKYGVKDAKGKLIVEEDQGSKKQKTKIKEDKIEDYKKELYDLFTLDVEIKYLPIYLKELCFEGFSLTMGEMTVLQRFIEEEGE